MRGLYENDDKDSECIMCGHIEYRPDERYAVTIANMLEAVEVCDNCGAEFVPHRRGHRFCSPKCAKHDYYDGPVEIFKKHSREQWREKLREEARVERQQREHQPRGNMDRSSGRGY